MKNLKTIIAKIPMFSTMITMVSILFLTINLLSIPSAFSQDSLVGESIVTSDSMMSKTLDSASHKAHDSMLHNEASKTVLSELKKELNKEGSNLGTFLMIFAVLCIVGFAMYNSFKSDDKKKAKTSSPLPPKMSVSSSRRR